MTDLSNFDPNSVGLKTNNIFGLPFREEDAQLVLLPVPWEVTVSYRQGTARGPENIFDASMQIDLYDPDVIDGWKKGFYMQPVDKNIRKKSDFLRQCAELIISHLTEGGEVEENEQLTEKLREINNGGEMLYNWVQEMTARLLKEGKKVGLIGGDHSTPLGFIKALSNIHPEFGVLQIDAHADLRNAYEGFKYSHASIMYNVVNMIPQVKKLVQVGIRDYCDEEVQVINDSFDIDGLDPKLCPNTGTPVPGGFEVEQVFYLFKQLHASGRELIGFDVNEVSTGIQAADNIDAIVGARVLYKLCNYMVAR